MSDMDNLLDGTLDDLADIPEFKPFPAGAHNCNLNFEVKKINDKTAVELKLTYIEPVELKDADAVPPAAGDTTNTLYQFYKKTGEANELGQGQFKAIIASLKAGLGLPDNATNRDVMEAANGAVAMVITSTRANKDDKTKVYTTVEEITIV